MNEHFQMVKNVPVGAFVADPTNPNVMPPGMQDRLGEIVSAVGFLQPILARRRGTPQVPEHLEGNPEAIATVLALTGPHFDIIDGHHRLEVAIAKGYTHVPAIIIDCTAERAKLIQIEMNHLRGELDLSAVARNMGDLLTSGLAKEDLLLSGFELPEIDALLKSISTIDENDAVMNGGAGSEEEQEDAKPPKPFELTLCFGSSKELSAVKRALRKAAGGGKQPDMAAGLLAMITGEKS